MRTIGSKSTFRMKNFFCFPRYISQSHRLCIWYNYKQADQVKPLNFLRKLLLENLFVFVVLFIFNDLSGSTFLYPLY